MATNKGTNADSSLTGFSFDDDSLFDFKSSDIGKGVDTGKGAVKGHTIDEPDDDDDKGKVTKLDDPNPKKEVIKDEEDVNAFEDFDDNTPPAKTQLKEVNKDKPTDKTPPKPVKTEDEDEELEDTASKDKDEDEDEDEDVSEDFFTNLANDLKENGVFQNVEIPKDKKLTQEEFFDLQDEEIEARVTETFEAFVEKLDGDAKQFIKFKQDGGSTREFLSQYFNPDFNLTEFDEDNPSHVKKTIDYYLRTVEKLDDDELADRKEWLEKGGKERSSAKKYYSIIEKAEKERKDAVIASANARAEQAKQETKEFNDSLIEVIGKVDTVGSFKITNSDKKGMGAYFTKPTVKVGKNNFIPQFQADLLKILKASSEIDKKKLITMGKLIKSDFKVDDLEKQVETTTTRRIRARVANTNPKATSTSGRMNKQLADMFD